MGGSLATISKYPGALDNLKRNAIVVELMSNNPAIDRIEREIRLDRDLKAAVRAGDLRKILNSSTVVRLLDDVELAQAVEAHRDELFEAIIVSVPDESRDQAFGELAKLRGMGVKEFKSYAAKRIAASQPQLDRADQPPFDATTEQLESAAEP